MRITLLLIFVHCCFTANAQNSMPSQLRFNHLFVKEGLIDGNVHSIIQDDKGYMWIGTHNGIVRYDGYQPKAYLLSGKKLNRTRISDIYVDSSGELWVGTYSNGLYKYDRPDDAFVLCTPDTINERFIQSGNIDNIINDRLGNIWFVLHDRLTGIESVFSFNIRQHRFTHFSNEEKDNHHINYSKYFSPLVNDNEGNLWCGSDNGLKKFDYNRDCFIEHQIANHPLLQKDFCMICSDKFNPHILWTAIWNDKSDKLKGIGRYNVVTDSLTIYHYPESDTTGLSDDYIYDMKCDVKGNLWIVTETALIFFDVAGKRFTNYIPPATDLGLKHIYSFRQDVYGNFWCLINGGSINGELAYFNTAAKQFTKYTSNSTDDKAFLSPHDLYIDHSGGLWFGVGNSGIQWINKEKSKITFHAFTNSNQKQEKRLFAGCAEAADHTIWFATDVGLCHWYPSRDTFDWVPLGKKSETQSLLRTTIIIDKEGCIWCGNYTPNFQGLYCYNPASKKLKTYVYNERDTASLSSNRVAAMLEDTSGDIWVGTYGGGLCRFNRKTEQFIWYPHISNVERTPFDNKLDDNDVQCMYKDKKGEIWIGTIWGSLNKLNKEAGTFTSFEDKVPLLKGVLSVYEDRSNNLWVGTFTNGLFLIDKKNGAVKRIAEKDGLLYNEIEGILEDKKGNLWLKSVRGISIYNPQTNSVRNITDELVENDMPNHMFYKTSNGLFIFSTDGGFVILNPNDFIPDSITPVVHIETVVFNKPQSKNKSVDSTIIRYGKSNIHLNYDENRITFNYVGLLYQNTAQIRYKYKLDGYDNNWINANTQRTVTYTNLSPGTYTFHVIAANSDNIWSKKGDAITVVIAPPFWETLWFRTLLALTIAGLVLLAVKYYLNRKLKAQQQAFNRLKEIEKVRSKISMDIHDEISSGLTKISLLSQRVKTRFEKDKAIEPEVIDKISGSSKEVISNLSEIIWAVNPKHDNLQSLLAYIRNYTSGFFDSTSIECTVSFPEDINAVNVAPDIKHNLFLVIKEALNNVVKHAQASAVDVCFQYTTEAYTFIIKDNGKGMEHLNGRAFGNGFTNMTKRMEAIGGNLTIHSEKNKGTQLLLKGRFRVETD